ncbi:MAG: threonylcarbamoyl-AMP synthase [Cyclobacteriaceae bacterium]|nr:threonylcarbamoyl-AMP synthase [Cyclobacteriaceae bacterium]
MATIGLDIQKATDILVNGGLVAIPTETVYGLAANAFNEEAITSIFKAKNRPSFDPLITHIADASQLNPLVRHIPNKAIKLVKNFWPGPLTIILPKTAKISDLITSGLDSAAFRVPNHPLTNELLKQVNFPLVAPSANPFAYVSPTTAQHVADQLGDKVDYILDGGPCNIGLESTIISFTKTTPKILRLGGLSAENIEQIIGAVDIQTHSTSAPEAPGMLTSHYSPGKPLLIGDIEQMIAKNKKKKIGIISFKKAFPNYINSVLATNENLEEAAQNLFKSLRWMANQPVDIILTEFVPNHGLGRAINDRLTRASSQQARHKNMK